MRPTISVVRAVGAEFARRIVRPIMIFGTIAAVVLLSVGGWLTAQNAWWWLLEVVFIIGSLIFGLLIVIVMVILRSLEPALTKAQKQSTRDFVDKLQRVAENLQTPQIVIVYYVVRDVMRPRAGSFVETVSRDSQALAPDFIQLRKDF